MADYYSDLEAVVVETFAQWDVRRVGFSWQKYYLDHTRQVQNLSVRMARELEADPEQLRVAAILHDITKRYDGVILKDAEGRNLVNSEGFWLNETVRPARQNWVTALYDRLELQGSVHHVSGAILSEHVLREFGLAEGTVRAITKIVAGHLKGHAPPELFDERYREPEVRILYDADTIDPNVGLAAFYRNIQINAGFALSRGEPVDLREYVEKLPRWVEAKASFRDQMLTDRGREICDERHSRMRELAWLLDAEFHQEAVNREFGLLGVVEYLFTNPEDPSLHEHAAGLRTTWLPEREHRFSHVERSDREFAASALERSRRFIDDLHQEIAGEL